MRKVAALLSFGLAVGLTPNALAAPNPRVVVAAFNKTLSSANASIAALEKKFEAEKRQANDALDLLIRKAESDYQSELGQVTALKSQIAKSKDVIRATIPIFDANNEVEFLQSSSFVGWKPWFSCVTLLPSCGDDAKTYTFKAGDRIKTRPAEIENLFPITFVEGLVQRGAVRLINPEGFQSSAQILKREILDTYEKSLKVESLVKEAESKKIQAVTDAESNHAKVREELLAAYEVERENLDPLRLASELAIAASKRTLTERANFDSAFATAVLFENNRKRLTEIANSEWTGEWNDKPIDNRVKVLKLSLTGESISKKYTRSAANAFNSTVGNAFTNEPAFRAALKVLTATYKQATKATLKF